MKKQVWRKFVQAFQMFLEEKCLRNLQTKLIPSSFNIKMIIWIPEEIDVDGFEEPDDEVITVDVVTIVVGEPKQNNLDHQ